MSYVKTALTADVYRWPEFRALWARLGLHADPLPTQTLTLCVPQDDEVFVIPEDDDPRADGPRLEVAEHDGDAVYHWPEFRALCARLGVAWELPTETLTLCLRRGGTVHVSQTYLGRDVASWGGGDRG
jgi:hypothetical protein